MLDPKKNVFIIKPPMYGMSDNSNARYIIKGMSITSCVCMRQVSNSPTCGVEINGHIIWAGSTEEAEKLVFDIAEFLNT